MAHLFAADSSDPHQSADTFAHAAQLLRGIDGFVYNTGV